MLLHPPGLVLPAAIGHAALALPDTRQRAERQTRAIQLPIIHTRIEMNVDIAPLAERTCHIRSSIPRLRQHTLIHRIQCHSGLRRRTIRKSHTARQHLLRPRAHRARQLQLHIQLATQVGYLGAKHSAVTISHKQACLLMALHGHHQNRQRTTFIILQRCGKHVAATLHLHHLSAVTAGRADDHQHLAVYLGEHLQHGGIRLQRHRKLIHAVPSPIIPAGKFVAEYAAMRIAPQHFHHIAVSIFLCMLLHELIDRQLHPFLLLGRHIHPAGPDILLLHACDSKAIGHGIGKLAAASQRHLHG